MILEESEIESLVVGFGDGKVEFWVEVGFWVLVGIVGRMWVDLVLDFSVVIW